MSPLAWVLVGSWLGGNAGLLLSGWLRGAKESDAYQAGYRRGVAHGLIRGAVREAVRAPQDDGARLLAEIQDEYELHAVWAEMDAHREPAA